MFLVDGVFSSRFSISWHTYDDDNLSSFGLSTSFSTSEQNKIASDATLRHTYYFVALLTQTIVVAPQNVQHIPFEIISIQLVHSSTHKKRRESTIKLVAIINPTGVWLSFRALHKHKYEIKKDGISPINYCWRYRNLFEQLPFCAQK